MTQIIATGHEVFALVARSGAWLATGGLVGVFHFLTLRKSTRMLAAGSSLLPGLALHLVRFAITASALALIAGHGVLPLLAATLGILASRTAVLGLGAPP